MGQFKAFAICAVFAGVAAISTQARAYTVVGGVTYAPTGITESLSADFRNPGGAATTSLFSGLVQISVSQSGFVTAGFTPTFEADAFYSHYSDEPSGADWTRHPTVLPSGTTDDYYQLVVTTDALVSNNLDDDAYKNIVYDLDAGMEVTSPYTPVYRADHTYNFVLNLASQTNIPSILHLGVNDGKYSDNDGSYQLQVTQLEPAAAVPLPPAALAGGIVLALMMFQRIAADHQAIQFRT